MDYAMTNVPEKTGKMGFFVRVQLVFVAAFKCIFHKGASMHLPPVHRAVH